MRYEVFPDGNEWSYRQGETRGGNYPTRSEAIAAAKNARGDTTEDLFRADGSLAGTNVVRGPEAIVLLRPDGSVYGELDHELGEGKNPQRITLTPASETDAAVNGG